MKAATTFKRWRGKWDSRLAPKARDLPSHCRESYFVCIRFPRLMCRSRLRRGAGFIRAGDAIGLVATSVAVLPPYAPVSILDSTNLNQTRCAFLPQVLLAPVTPAHLSAGPG